MEFRLVYEGRLKANGTARDKQEIRRAFHPQLRDLWTKLPLSELRRCVNDGPPDGSRPVPRLLRDIGAFRFAPLVSPKLNLVARLKIEFLRPQEPGALVSTGGDIDNRIKTLLDALRMPKNPDELPKEDAPRADEMPFFCLLEDDVLVTELAVITDRLLDAPSPEEVLLLIQVRLIGTTTTWDNIGIIG